MGRNVRGAVPLLGEAGSPSNTMSPGPRSTSLPSGILIHPVIWPRQTRAENEWGYAPLARGRGGPLSNTMWQGPRPSSIASDILIHSAAWPQLT